MQISLNIWRQYSATDPGKFVQYTVESVSSDLSFLEVLDILNEQLTTAGERPVAFDHDCREGICGSCGMMVNGQAHGPQQRTSVCQLYMRNFKDGDTITLEPWRAKAFPIVKDLVVDRSAFDRIAAAGGYVAVRTGAAPEASALLVDKPNADTAFDYATCIACGACVGACPNASASLFTAAKISHLASLPQGHPDRKGRVVKMTQQMTQEGFGDCSNHGECQSVCPKGISIDAIAQMRREYIRAQLPFG